MTQLNLDFDEKLKQEEVDKEKIDIEQLKKWFYSLPCKKYFKIPSNIKIMPIPW